MAYRFRISETLGAGSRRIAREITDKTIRLATERGQPLGVGVHEARKGVKKLRSLIRLVSPVSKSPEALKDADRFLKRAAKMLASRRDEDVIHLTLSKLAAEGANAFGPKQAAVIFNGLARQNKAEKEDAAFKKDFAKFSGMISDIRLGVADWAFHQSALQALDRGYIATYHDARTGILKILEKPTDKRLHDWRRLVKYHLYHARLLESIKAGCDRERIEKIKLLEGTLGDHHDLVMLKERIKSLPKKRRDKTICRVLFKLMKKRRRMQEARSVSLASELFTVFPAPRLVSPPSDGEGFEDRKQA